MRRGASTICAVLIGIWASSSLAQQPPAEPSAADAEVSDGSTGLHQPSELYELLGIDDAFFAKFVDGQPLDAAQQEGLLKLLIGMRRMGPHALEKFRKSAREIASMERDPSRFQGDVVGVPGVTTFVVRELLDPQLRERFQIDAWYRCQATTYTGNRVTMYALAIPRAWPLEQPTRRIGRSLALFVKSLPPSNAEAGDKGQSSSSLLFVAPRMVWHPDSLLGQLGMDYGLFDEVRDRHPLEERECFYQMLAAVRESERGRIERAGREGIAARRDLLERLARNPHQRAEDRAAAQRGLERAEENCDDVVPLFNNPAEQRGKLFMFSGEALRAIKIQVDDPDIVERFGIDHYYEVEIITADSQNNPIVCCVAELPPDMPLGESIHQSVRIAGFFLKTWAFDTRKTALRDSQSGQGSRRQLAPLLIARTLRVVKAPVDAPPNLLLPAVLVVLVFAAMGLMWYVRRGDRRALAKAAGIEATHSARIAFDQMDDAAGSGASDES